MKRILGLLIVGLSLSSAPSWGDDLLWVKSVAGTHTGDSTSWYVQSYRQPQPLKIERTAKDPLTESTSSDIHLQGGYQSPLRDKLHWFVEAGLALDEEPKVSDLASREGFNVGTGLRFTPSDSLVLSGQLLHSKTPHNFDSLSHSLLNFDMQLQGVYKLPQQLDIKASYRLLNETPSELEDQQLQIGLNYHF